MRANSLINLADSSKIEGYEKNHVGRLKIQGEKDEVRLRMSNRLYGGGESEHKAKVRLGEEFPEIPPVYIEPKIAYTLFRRR